jgi:hypothetical protein
MSYIFKFFKSKQIKVCALGAVAKAINLNGDTFKVRVSKGNHKDNTFKTTVTSNVNLHLGKGGFFTKKILS